jgi:3',5'-cyclic AMP phosphodiesterase CpdA
MRRLVHISDLHFGTEDPIVAEALLADVAGLSAHVVAVSGDLTQRARAGQFAAARAYLERIELPQVVVPGNHDIPLYNVFARFLRPLDGYCRYFACNLFPAYADAELAVAGVNTARSNTWKDGRIAPEQVERLESFYKRQPPHALKVLVAHHPFVPPARDPGAALVGGASAALRVLERVGCSLILAGHLHHAYVGDATVHHVEIKRSILVVQAGTAISRRRRDEANAYNVLTFDGSTLSIEVRAWTGSTFAPAASSSYRHTDDGWRPLAPESSPSSAGGEG